MKKFAFAAVCVLGMVGFVMADDITCTVTKVEGNTVFYKKGGKMAEEMKADLTSDAKVLKGEFVPDPVAPPAKKAGGKKAGGKGGAATGTWKAGDPLPGGVKADAFAKIDADKGGPFCQITTNADGKITQIITTGEPKAKGKGKKGG